MTQTDYPVGQWIGWNGGECPVHPETVVEVEFGCRDEGLARHYVWDHGDEDEDNIIAFRIVTPYVEPAPKLECWVVAHEDGHVSSAYRSHGLAANAQRVFGGRVIHMVEADE